VCLSGERAATDACDLAVKLADTLRALGIDDPHVDEVARALSAYSA
jgi:hypothetical protein